MISAHSWPGPHLQPRARPSRWLGQGLQSEPGLVCSCGAPHCWVPSTRPPRHPQSCDLPRVAPGVRSTGPTAAQVSQPQPPVCSPSHPLPSAAVVQQREPDQEQGPDASAATAVKAVNPEKGGSLTRQGQLLKGTEGKKTKASLYS